MWENTVRINHPFGVSVFGSALIRISPDFVTIVSAVSRIEQKPKDSFSKAREGAREASDFLRRSNVQEYGLARIVLSKEFRFASGEQRFVGYKAKIGITVVLRDLDRVEAVMMGLVDAGVNEISSTTFQTSRLKELRAQVRKMAVEAAREKATLYAAASNVTLGRIIHIEDVNPQVLQGRGEGHVQREPVVDDEAETRTLDPGAIEVGAAVLIGFSLANHN
jgi:uncharacterized protein YggE